jgi:hypothetical protein
MRLAAVLFFCVWLTAQPAFARATLGGVTIDPTDQVREGLLAETFAAWRMHPEAQRDRLAIADFSAPSTQRRFFLIDLKTGAVEAYRTAHGKGSDPGHTGWAQIFSNGAATNASSLGAYVTGARYTGAHGLSLYLDGKDPTNTNARARAIVIHSAPYMAPAFIAMHGKPGRSWGCFVVAPDEIAHVVSWLEGGVLLYAGK